MTASSTLEKVKTPAPATPPSYGPLVREKLQYLSITKLILDCEDYMLYVVPIKGGGFEFKKVMHTVGYRGYQRDPNRRKAFIKSLTINFEEALYRPFEVSDRGNGYYAVLDAGGRLFMAILLGIAEVPCRVHSGKTIAEEARLFRDFAKMVRQLGAVGTFQASVTAGNKIAMGMHDAMLPYRIGVGNKLSIGSTGAINCIYDVLGARMLSRTAKVMANIWGPDEKSKPKRAGHKVAGNCAVSVAAMIEIGTKLPGGLDEARLRVVMAKPEYSPSQLLAKAKGTAGTKTQRLPYAMCEVLAADYNKGRPKNQKISTKDIANSEVLEAFAKHQYSGYQHEKF